MVELLCSRIEGHSALTLNHTCLTGCGIETLEGSLAVRQTVQAPDNPEDYFERAGRRELESSEISGCLCNLIIYTTMMLSQLILHWDG